MQAQHAKIAKFRLALKEHQQPTLRREPSMVEGAPVIAHAEGHFVAGETDQEDTLPVKEPTGAGDRPTISRGKAHSSLSLAPTVVSSPREEFFQDAQSRHDSPLITEEEQKQIEYETAVAALGESAAGLLEAAASTTSSGAARAPVTNKEMRDKTYFRMRRYCASKKASAEIIKLWATRDGRDKIRELLLKNGMQFPPVELQIRKWKSKDPDGATMSSDVPDLASNAEDLLKRGQGEGVSPGDQAAASSGSFKLVFPAVQENASAVAILPHFLEVCGRKLDNCHGVQDTQKI
ncbi:unnamed protein product [Cladocopium goreaui]|uniref:Uncharacterized protein n=1 Tax=Cladocopium goreaui TaxID=2562237 RepID=A0A9P1BJW4_9DINO|nr:unnamed protein product [Cladocopium goreaui]